MSLKTIKQVLGGLSLLACTSAMAGTLTVDISNVDSDGLFRNPGNSVLNYNVGANSFITSVSYWINITAFNPSRLSEMGVAITNSKVTEGLLLNPADIYTVSGTGTFSDTLDLVFEDLSFEVGVDGILRLEFYEDFNDARIDPDGRWNFGTITFGFEEFEDPAQVPEPASALLLASGIAALGVARRRRAGHVTN